MSSRRINLEFKSSTASCPGKQKHSFRRKCLELYNMKEVGSQSLASSKANHIWVKAEHSVKDKRFGRRNGSRK